jgi:hypothetical protein
LQLVLLLQQAGAGTAGVVALTIAGNTVTVASATTDGDGYKVGDTLTFDKSVIGGTTDVVITLVADDLDAIEGSATNEYQLIPIDNVLAVDNLALVQLQARWQILLQIFMTEILFFSGQ